MATVIATAKVKDGAKWEQGFRTHAELFREQTIHKPIHFSVSDDNEITILFEPDDLEKYLELLDSSATYEAMAYDGVDEDTIKIVVLDKDFDPH